MRRSEGRTASDPQLARPQRRGRQVKAGMQPAGSLARMLGQARLAAAQHARDGKPSPTHASPTSVRSLGSVAVVLSPTSPPVRRAASLVETREQQHSKRRVARRPTLRPTLQASPLLHDPAAPDPVPLPAGSEPLTSTPCATSSVAPASPHHPVASLAARHVGLPVPMPVWRAARTLLLHAATRRRGCGAVSHQLVDAFHTRCSRPLVSWPEFSSVLVAAMTPGVPDGKVVRSVFRAIAPRAALRALQLRGAAACSAEDTAASAGSCDSDSDAADVRPLLCALRSAEQPHAKLHTHITVRCPARSAAASTLTAGAPRFRAG